MKAVWYERPGPASQVLCHGEQPPPSPGEREVLVALRTSGVNPSDVKARAGTRGGASALAYPRIIPHSDGAGIVAAVGSSVRQFRAGDRVWLANAQWNRADGTAAEYIALDESLVFELPNEASFETGAALGIPAVTACHAALGYGSIEGKTVLVSGGAGTVGRLAVQFAREGGARVIATGRGEHDRARTLAAGAHAYVDFTSAELQRDVLAANGGRRVEHVIEVEYGVNADMSAELIAPRGTIVAYGSAAKLRPELPFYPLLFKGVRMEFLLVYLLTAQERAAAASRINELLGAGRLDIPIHEVLALKECARAHELVESGRRQGAVVIACNA